MKNNRAILPLLTIAMLAGACLPSTAQAAANQTISTDWGNAPGLRSPHPDSKGRSGHWWWPTATNSSGNKGKVYSKRRVDAATATAETPVPPPTVHPQPPIVCGHVIINNLLFHTDSVELRPEGIAETQKIIAELQKYPRDTVTCVGHTDDVGAEAYNLQLGLRRAQAVVDYMIHSGIEPNRLRAESKGESEPAVPNNTPANRALNRRVVFKITLGS